MKNMNKVITTKEGSTSTVEIKGNTVKIGEDKVKLNS